MARGPDICNCASSGNEEEKKMKQEMGAGYMLMGLRWPRLVRN